MIVCLFLPQARDCHGHEENAFQSGFAALIIPVAVIGLLPLLWRVSPYVRQFIPELSLLLAVISMVWLVVGIPVAVMLVVGYVRRWFRGETLTAVSSATCVASFIVLYPIAMMFGKMLPAGAVTWFAACAETLGLLLWSWSASTRPNADEPWSSRPGDTP